MEDNRGSIQKHNNRLEKYLILEDDCYRNTINIHYNVSLTLHFCFPCFSHCPYCVAITVSIQTELRLKMKNK